MATIVKRTESERGKTGETQLVQGERMALRLWDQELPNSKKSHGKHSNDYEVVGYAIAGKAELHLEDEVIPLEAGTSWVVPANRVHAYKILETFTAVEATSL
jgi:quercetin dioxygenase-like cupin family protein